MTNEDLSKLTDTALLDLLGRCRDEVYRRHSAARPLPSVIGLNTRAFKAARVLALGSCEDFDKVCAESVRSVKNVGGATLGKIRAYLKRHGRDFRRECMRDEPDVACPAYVCRYAYCPAVRSFRGE